MDSKWRFNRFQLNYSLVYNVLICEYVPDSNQDTGRRYAALPLISMCFVGCKAYQKNISILESES